MTITNGHAREGAGGSNAGTFGSTGGAGNPGANGGGILNEGILTLVHGAVTASHAGDGGNGGQGGSLGGSGGVGAAGGQGGGIFSIGTLTVSDSTISGNSAGNGGVGGVGTHGSIANAQSGNGGSGGSGGGGGGGGGVAAEGGSATITTSTIEGNRSGAGGRGQAGEDSDPSQGFGGEGGSGGSGGTGAGIAIAGASVSLQATNDTVEGNVTGDGANGQNAGGGVGGEDGQPGNGGSGGYGAGLLDVHSAVQLANLTVADNSTGKGGSGGAASNTHPAGTAGSDGHGGGIYATLSSPTLQNTLLGDNEPGGDCRGESHRRGPQPHLLAADTRAATTAGPVHRHELHQGGSQACAVGRQRRADADDAPAAREPGDRPGPDLGCGMPASRSARRHPTGWRGLRHRLIRGRRASGYDRTRDRDRRSRGDAYRSSHGQRPHASVHFEYGTNAGYGKSTADQHVAGVVAVSVLARGERPDTRDDLPLPGRCEFD